jgi:hypothetical protein
MNIHPIPCLILAVLAALALSFLTGCASEAGMATPGWWAPAAPGQPSARFGVLLELPDESPLIQPHPAK